MQVNASFLMRLRSQITKWRLCLLAFLTVYAIVVSFDLGYMSMQWDEVNHFTGGLLLTRFDFEQYILTSSFYPPVMNVVTACYFAVAGASVAVGRAVALTFSLLSMVMVYKFARKAFDSKTALFSAVLFGVMPGVVWLSRIAMIETMLIFIFTLSMFFFYRWLTGGKDRYRIISIAALIVGVTVKYQTLVLAPIIMITSMLLMGKKEFLKAELRRLLSSWRLVALGVGCVVAAVLVYALLAAGLLQTWLYAIQVGTAEKALYSVRFPAPVFYLIEMTWPYSDMHPISLFLYIAGLLGLGLMAYRRKPMDKFLLIWFIVTYALFTVIPNRQWRYVNVVYPVLAISAASLAASAFNKAQTTWRNLHFSASRRYAAKVSAVFLAVFLATGIFFSCADAYTWVQKDHVRVPLQEATEYAMQSLGENESIMVACPFNLLNQYMIYFYLNAKAPSSNWVWQYPELAVDAYTPVFSVDELVAQCRNHAVKYVFLYEYGEATHYFNTTLTPRDVYNTLNSNPHFAYETNVGVEPRRIYIFSFS